MANFKAAYLAKCLSANELFKVADTIKEYHYTLYYYDQAGNLVKTVPPKGVNPVYRQSFIDSVEAAKLNGTQLTPVHSLVTRYCYNTLNQVNIQKSPDGGVSRFWYDRLGRLTISQNAKQIGSGNVYSYTLYDSLGRITQVAQLTGGSTMTDATSRSDASLQSWLTNATNTRNQITQTVYDTAYGPINGITLSQQNLRNRVSYTQVINNATDTYPASATYYSYDIHGNVDTLLQDYGYSTGIANVMNTTGNRFKKIVYNYDLISGKVNQVCYQPNYLDIIQQKWVKPDDQYFHRYAYDAENRLTDVTSGRDSVMLFLFPEREAHYSYYKHGPLARTELGQLRVQGLDYAYTLQGWLKGINPTMGGTLANGTDTTEPYPVTQDVYGLSLHYYKNDYKAIGYTPSATTIPGALTTNAAPLFNGNIAAMAVNIPNLGMAKVYNYHYDQLNRIVAMDAYNGLTPTAGTFVPVSISDYQERVSYDPNGNILSYQRNGDAARPSMDNLSYYYKSNTNQLHKVTDAAADATTNYSLYNDIKQGQTDNNYQYDAIGNLTSDVSEGITNISWSVYGKITSITKGGTLMKYVYDASGNRIMKQTASDTTVYVRDASGNVMSVYTRKVGGALVQTETHLYGSSRLGMATQHIAPDTTILLSGNFGSAINSTFTRGEKIFELSNHLGNVLVTISDRRIQASAGGQTVDNYTADVITANDYYPGGMLMPGRKYTAPNSSYRYGFNGKENDNEVKGEGNQQDYGMRIYDPRLGRFLSTDPITKNYPELTPYQFASNTAIQAIDLDGLEAYAVYNKATSQLALIPDISKVNPKLTNKFVSAFEYNKLTEMDRAKANYGILVKNVFTGGHSDAGQIVHDDPSRPKEKPISTGKYNILENKGNTNPEHNSFFVLDPQDKHPYDKIDDRPGEVKPDGTKRDGYNLHPGRVSWGCVTICKDDPVMSPNQREEEWKIINGAVNNTKTEVVPDNRGLHKYMLGSTQIKYGALKVIDEKPTEKKP
jgi:RHS repeat-associated protein